MYLEKFLEGFRELSQKITNQITRLEDNPQKGFYEMQGLLGQLQELLPEWFYFIEHTGIGTKEHVIRVLSDMEAAMEAEDSILLGDALLYGLRAAVEEYSRIIDEALHEK